MASPTPMRGARSRSCSVTRWSAAPPRAAMAGARGKSLALAMVRPDLATIGTELDDRDPRRSTTPQPSSRIRRSIPITWHSGASRRVRLSRISRICWTQDRPGHTLPQQLYVGQEAFDFDTQVMLKSVWLYACTVAHVKKPGDYFIFELANNSIIIIRGRDGEVRAFHNSCRHRGARICQEQTGQRVAADVPLSYLDLWPRRQAARRAQHARGVRQGAARPAAGRDREYRRAALHLPQRHSAADRPGKGGHRRAGRRSTISTIARSRCRTNWSRRPIGSS